MSPIPIIPFLFRGPSKDPGKSQQTFTAVNDVSRVENVNDK